MENPTERSVADQLIEIINNMSRTDILALLTEIIESMTEEEQRVLLADLMTRSLKRENARHNVFSAIEFSVEGKTYKGIIQNISVSGLFIETKESFPVGDEILMKIPFFRSPKKISVQGQIVRITPHGIGVKFYKNMGD